MTTTDPLQNLSSRATQCYLSSLKLMTPYWEGHPNTPKRIAKRVALQLLECAETDSDVLLGIVFLRTYHNTMAEHSLKTAVLIAHFARFLSLPPTLSYRAVLCGLLHHFGHDTRGALAQSKGYLAQRSLITLLLDPNPDTTAYQQILSAFQLDLGMDTQGQPALNFPVRPHPLALLLGLCNDFIEELSAPPNSAVRAPSTLFEAFAHLQKHANRRHHPSLVDALIRAIGPAPVGTVLELEGKQRAMVIRCQVNDRQWAGQAVTLSPPPKTVEVGSHMSSQVLGVVDTRAALRQIAGGS